MHSQQPAQAQGERNVHNERQQGQCKSARGDYVKAPVQMTKGTQNAAPLQARHNGTAVEHCMSLGGSVLVTVSGCLSSSGPMCKDCRLCKQYNMMAHMDVCHKPALPNVLITKSGPRECRADCLQSLRCLRRLSTCWTALETQCRVPGRSWRPRPAACKPPAGTPRRCRTRIKGMPCSCTGPLCSLSTRLHAGAASLSTHREVSCEHSAHPLAHLSKQRSSDPCGLFHVDASERVFIMLTIAVLLWGSIRGNHAAGGWGE